jgi:hypothetical protein
MVENLPGASEMTSDATEKAAGFTDYPKATETPASEKNAPAVTAKRPRPVLCIADHCVCQFVTNQAYDEPIPRDQLPMGCARL